MDFRLLQVRLIEHIERRVHNGETTERSLARRSGISQPHLHNVLKGARSMSPEMADQILHCLHIDLLDLAAGEVRAFPLEKPVYRAIACLDGLIGPGHPFPGRECRHESYPLHAADLEGIESPVAVRLAPDPRMAGVFAGGDVAVLDRSEIRRVLPDETGYYALDVGGASAIRRVRLSGRVVYPINGDSDAESRSVRPISTADRNLLQLVRGRVARLVRHM